MKQYQRMVSYLYEYKQGIKGVNVGYVRIEQRAGTCRISLQMRSRNLSQLPDVAVFHQRADGIRYFPVGSLTERNGDYRCRIDTDAENLMDSGIRLSDADGIILYQDDSYYIATTWKNQGIFVGKSDLWDPEEPDDVDEPGQEQVESDTRQAVLEQSDMPDEDSLAVYSGAVRNNGQTIIEEENHDRDGQSGLYQNITADVDPVEPEPKETQPVREAEEMQPVSSQIPDQAGSAENVSEPDRRRLAADQKEQMEAQAVCRNCPFKRKSVDYGKRILMTFPVMRPFPNDQTHACVRIEPQDLGCLPMQMWSLANNHFLLQGYYCYRHLIFVETENQGYALGVPGLYSRRERSQAEQFGFTGFRAICSGKQCEGAFGYWMMPLSC